MFAPRLELAPELGYLFPMKYGAHCYLFTRSWSDADLPLLDLARELGLDMFELSVGDDVAFDPRLTGRRAAALGLDLVIGPGGLETYNSGLGDFAYERGIFQDLCPDGRAFVEKGIAFLRALEARIIDPARRRP
jgi:hypothetical protein